MFENDKKNGYGIEIYDNDIYYEGEFKNNLKEGKGKLILNKSDNNNGNYVYSGDFHPDQISGNGRLLWDSQKEYIGEFKNNEMNGYGMLLDDNVRYIGYFRNNLKDGYGASLFSDESYLLLGKWENDNAEGNCIVIPLGEYKEKEESFVLMFKGNPSNTELTQENISKFKESEEYKEMKDLYSKKLYPDFLKYLTQK